MRSFLNKLSHAIAITHDGIIYGITSIPPKIPLKYTLVLTINQARQNPTVNAIVVTAKPIFKLLRSGL